MSAPTIRGLFRQWVDEPSTSWLTDAQVADWLGFAYEQFRVKVSDVDRSIFLTGVTLTLTAAQLDYDLAAAASAVRILGNPAGGLTHARLRRAYDVYNVDANGRPNYYLTPTKNLRQLTSFQRNQSLDKSRPHWYLSGTTLSFDPAPGAGSFTLVYLPEQGVSWATSSTNVVDDLVAFHDVIALLAARSYLARDGVDNPALEKLILQRTSELEQWLISGRNADATDMVLDEFP